MRERAILPRARADRAPSRARKRKRAARRQAARPRAPAPRARRPPAHVLAPARARKYPSARRPPACMCPLPKTLARPPATGGIKSQLPLTTEALFSPPPPVRPSTHRDTPDHTHGYLSNIEPRCCGAFCSAAPEMSPADASRASQAVRRAARARAQQVRYVTARAGHGDRAALHAWGRGGNSEALATPRCSISVSTTSLHRRRVERATNIPRIRACSRSGPGCFCITL